MPEQSELNAARQNSPQHDPMHLEQNQPDPRLDMSNRRMGSGGISLVAIGILVLLAIVSFGLNGRSTDTSRPAQTIPLASK